MRGFLVGLVLIPLLVVGVLSVEGLEETQSVPIKGLAGEALLAGASADRAVGPVEDSGGIGDAALGG